MNDKVPETPAGEFLLYTTEDGKSRVECRFENETIWLSQALMGELFDRDVRTINEHLKNLYEEEELKPEATIRKFRIVRIEGLRQVKREIDHYNLEALVEDGEIDLEATCKDYLQVRWEGSRETKGVKRKR